MHRKWMTVGLPIIAAVLRFSLYAQPVSAQRFSACAGFSAYNYGDYYTTYSVPYSYSYYAPALYYGWYGYNPYYTSGYSENWSSPYVYYSAASHALRNVKCDLEERLRERATRHNHDFHVGVHAQSKRVDSDQCDVD